MAVRRYRRLGIIAATTGRAVLMTQGGHREGTGPTPSVPLRRLRRSRRRASAPQSAPRRPAGPPTRPERSRRIGDLVEKRRSTGGRLPRSLPAPPSWGRTTTAKALHTAVADGVLGTDLGDSVTSP